MVALSLLLARTCVGVICRPTTTGTGQDGAGGVSASAVTLPQSFTPMTSPPKMVLLGVGTQNYTCNSKGTYDSVGAYAQLYDTSRVAISLNLQLSGIPNLDNVAADGTFYPTRQNSVLTPVWNLKSTSPDANKSNTNTVIYGQKVNSAPSSNGTNNVDWVKYKTSGGSANRIYGVDTVGGQPPTSCKPGAHENVKYAATYWLD